ncbi:hypothetical protein RHSIM_RhsimUnG0122200 [Rhododendron simsii]|uniref:Myb/SANT-like domain-containing protein n=1 Tax=Rhododendron simsii TaxID=118357 RepID=A0A834FVE0_RHOSS|nr:hypothetical protein RHSIM_RhsimUnG0122200 [Rhododendron simsii]
MATKGNVSIKIEDDDEVEVGGVADSLWLKKNEALFIDIMEEEVKTMGSRDTGTFQIKSWARMRKSLSARAKYEYSELQIKNKFNQLRTMHTKFKSLCNQSGVGWCAEKGTITADDALWEKLYKVNKKAKHFRKIFANRLIAGTPRPLWTAASQIVMAVGYVIMAMALPGSLYVGSIFVGVCYGVRYAIMVSTASELFGLKYYGLIYNILILNLPLGSFLFSGLLAGYFYDAQATSTAGGGNSCTGAHCYRLVFVIMSIACIIGFSLDVLLVIRTKNLYAKIYASMA